MTQRAGGAGLAPSTITRWPLALATIAVLCAPARALAGDERPGPTAASPAGPVVIYGGDRAFPPYEYRDTDGQPRGFDVELVRALAAQAGVRVEIRLEEWWTLLADFDAGRIDLVSLPMTEERARRYDLVAQTWTFQQEVVFADRAHAPRRLEDLAGRRIAVAPGTLTHTLLTELDPGRRPELVPADELPDALRAVREGRADGAAGNGLALRAAARDAGMSELAELPLRSVPYALATAKGRGRAFSWVGEALNRLHETGQFNHLVEDHLIIRPGPVTWRDFALPLGLGSGALATIGIAAVGWTRVLRGQVRARTRELAQSLAEKDALATSLQDRERQLQDAQQIAQVGSWEWTLGTDEVRCSEELLRLLGVDPATFPGRREALLDLVHPDDRADVGEAVRRAAAEGRPLELDHRIVRGDGQVRHLHVRAEVAGTGAGAVKRLVGTAQDITQRKLGELAVEREREQLRSIVSHAPAAMAILDRELRYVAHSERWLKYWRLRGRPLLGRRHDELFPGLPEPYRAALRQALEGKVVTRREDPFPLGDGSTVYIRWTVHPWRGASRAVDGVVVVVQNIDVLVRARETAREASRLKSEFLANMSHEIRTPLNGVMGMTRLLIDTRLDRQQREYAEMIRESGRTLLDLVSDILDFSKIEAGRLELETLAFDPALAAEEAVVAFAERAHSKGLELTVDVDPEVPRSVVGDRGRLGQVLSNLLANAVKFTERGEVVARVGVLEEWEDEVVVRFSVRDSGVGIPETALPRLFQPFTQADTSTTRRFGGTGLGLAISKRLVEMMGGGIGVSSTPGEGSTFWFTARFKRQGEPRRAVDPLPLAGRLALIAAPSEAVGETLERQLGALGVIVRRADSVRAARGTLEDESSEDIDLVVLDAGLDGLEVAAFAREVRERSRVTRILLLVPIGAAAVEGGEGPDSVLTKPIRPSVLRERLAAIVTGDTPVTVPEPAGAAPTGVDRHAPLVLVVEDNEINRTVAIRSLERLGYRATGARHGAEAVEKFAPETYAAVLMDCQMPVMDGYEATVQLRAAEVGRRPTPVLALTAGALVGDRERCLAAGMDDYIAKPVVFEQLAATLARWAPVGTVSVDAPLFSMPATAGLDTRVIDQLRALDTPGSGFFQGVIGLFLDTTPGRLAALARALAEHDLATVQAVAHGLRSTCGNVGARRMHDLCAEIEEGAGNGGQELALRLRALGDEFAEVRQALEAEQRRVRPGASAAGSSS